MPKAQTQLAATIRRARPAGMSQIAAARAIGVSRRTLQRWESGEQAPDVEELRRLCAAYGANLSDMLK